ncbi:MAG: RluA family pseudouridine synthase [Sphingobacteriaceae bacterium]|jgi:23S rRNA pseudouridine955/2504/2580 synthase
MKFPHFKDLILFEDDHVIVINKPAFISTLDDRSGDTITIIRMAKQYLPDAQVCHRLDRETSGALVIAKDPETYRLISMQFEHREVTKIYHAFVDGHHKFDDLLIDLPIVNYGKSNVKIDKIDGKKAETYFKTLQYFKHYTLIECKPLTGRMHQIRIHLATQRASITGDDLYGGKPFMLSSVKRNYRLSKEQEEQPIMKRFALHARSIGFKLADDTAIQIEAPYPKDFDTMLKMLQKFDV